MTTAPLLRARGYDVDTVRDEDLTGQSDDAVWHAARAESRFLVTQALDFSDTREFTPGSHHEIPRVRLPDAEQWRVNDDVVAWLSDADAPPENLILSCALMRKRHFRLTVLLLALVWSHGSVLAQEASIGVYGQASNQQQTHVMPRVSVRAPTGSWIRAEAAYFIDVASRASVDLLTGRSVPQDRRTQHELTALFGVDTAKLRAAAHYRYVNLPDYVSHTVDIPSMYGWPDWATKLTFQPYVRWNEIRRISDPSYAQSSRMFGARVGFQPWLDARTVGQLTYELQYATGFLASPYNYVGLGTSRSGFACVGAALCVPERLPNQRVQHAAVLQGRRALAESASVGLLYRFFVDDWSMTSHTLEPDVTWLPWQGGLLRLRYRLYLQSASEASRNAHTAQPLAADSAVYLTADARWAQLHTQRLSLELEHTFAIEEGVALTFLVAVGGYRVSFTDDVYPSSNALEGTTFAALKF